MNGIYSSPPPRGPGFFSKLGSFIEKLLLILLLLALAGLGWHLFRNGKLPGMPKPAPPEVWTRQKLGLLSMEVPMLLEPKPGKNISVSADKLRYLEKWEVWSGTSTDGFEVVCYFMKGNGTGLYSLEDAWKALIGLVAKDFQVPNSAVTKREVGVDGLPGRYFSHTGLLKGQNGHVAAVMVQESRKVWGVIVMGPAPKRVEDTQRVLQSIRIQRE